MITVEPALISIHHHVRIKKCACLLVLVTSVLLGIYKGGYWVPTPQINSLLFCWVYPSSYAEVIFSFHLVVYIMHEYMDVYVHDWCKNYVIELN